VTAHREERSSGQRLPEALLTAEQVAAQLAVPKSWVYSAARRGELPTVVLGRYRRFRGSSVAAWARARER